MNVSDRELQLKTFTETEILNCCFTATGQLVLDSANDLDRQPTLHQKAHFRAAIYWLKHYQPDRQASQLKQVRGYLEAAYHLGQLEAWDLIRQILFVRLDSDRNLPLHQQLGIWGLYREQIDLCQPLLGKANHELDCLCLNNLGYAYTHLCQYQIAVNHYQRLLQLATENHNTEAQAKALGGLGLCYGNWGQYQTAWNYCQQQLQVLDRIDESRSSTKSGNAISVESLEWEQDSYGECPSTVVERGQTFATLGYLEIHLRRYRKAIYYCQQALAIAHTINDTQTQWYALGRLAVANAQLGKRQKALDALQQQYQQRHQNYNCRQVSAVLVNLGLVYCYQRNFQAAINCGQELLEINQQNGDISAQCYALLTLSFIHIWQDEVQLAMEKTRQCLSLARQFNYPHHESQSLSQFSYLHSAMGEIPQAKDYGEQALAIAQNVNNSLFKGIAFAVLGLAYLEAGKFVHSLRFIVASFITLPPWRGGDSKLLLALILKRFFKYLSKLSFIHLNKFVE
ncbi:tetratricopeptide repeat protein [Nostoc sp. 'Peltigera membranacea cyanobiont' N6]|uniref:tetratricopeptide repeat protein n=1 Tax=Nostoc sp. 'Peltigera membranacea cyanobiont' N6 TaxID=1261031 RepID=UPI000CF32B95|nr:tetratricopeptide repeat protein [Nostoc sp. 'Peltigera membranacea cyanobiont' N6]